VKVQTFFYQSIPGEKIKNSKIIKVFDF